VGQRDHRRQHNGDSAWQVSVSDPQAAEAQLLKLLVDGPVVVTEFRRKQYELEDIFMQVIEGGQMSGNSAFQLVSERGWRCGLGACSRASSAAGGERGCGGSSA